MSQSEEKEPRLRLVDVYDEKFAAKVYRERVDKDGQRPHDESMSSITREEFDAKLETIEVKMDARVASIESKIDLLLMTTSDRSDRMDKSIDQMQADNKNLKYWMIGTAIATVIGLYAANISLVQLGKDAFGSGKQSAQEAAEIKTQNSEIVRRLDAMERHPVSSPSTSKDQPETPK